MILFREQHDDVNVIHLIMGNETDFQLDMSGNMVVDLSENIDPSKRNILYINRCESEEELQEQITFYQERNSDHKCCPVHAPGKIEKSKPDVITVSTSKSTKEYGVFHKDVKCPKCLSWGCYIKDGVISMCDVCKRIEEGLTSKDIPPPPLKKDREDIVQNFFKKKQDRQDNG